MGSFFVDEQNIPQQFKKLEKRVEQLVQKCRDLQDAKSGLETKLSELEQALMTKDVDKQKYVEEKTIIRSKMDDLVGRLDEVLQSA
jgi:peptidoglycan hydrolase CwlO-like protein